MMWWNKPLDILSGLGRAVKIEQVVDFPYALGREY